MTPEDNIRWYWNNDLSQKEQADMLVELYNEMSDKQREYFLQKINK